MELSTAKAKLNLANMINAKYQYLMASKYLDILHSYLVAQKSLHLVDPRALPLTLCAMPLILSIETATKLCTVAVGTLMGRVLALREEESERHTHAEKVNVFIEEVMAEAGLTMSDLDAVAVGIGPGSYTGLRIGLSAAKGLCYVRWAFR